MAFLNTTFFFQGFVQGSGPKRAEDGELTLTLPFGDVKLRELNPEPQELRRVAG